MKGVLVPSLRPVDAVQPCHVVYRIPAYMVRARGRVVHLTRGGGRTLCGWPVADLLTQEQYEGGRKCLQCGGHLDAARRLEAAMRGVRFLRLCLDCGEEWDVDEGYNDCPDCGSKHWRFVAEDDD